MLEQAAKSTTITIPAEFRTVTRQVQDVAPSSREIPVAEQTRQVTNRVLVSAASQRAIEVPAVSKAMTRRVINTPASTREIDVPAVYKTVKRQVIDTEATVREVTVPAVTRKVRLPIVAEQAKVETDTVPEQYGTVSKTVKVSDASVEWRSILFEVNTTPAKVREIKEALKKAGFNRDCPLEIFHRRRELHRFPGIGPKPFKLGSSFASDGQAKRLLGVPCVVIPQRPDGQHLMVQRWERVVYLLAHHSVAKHTHQVVRQHRHPQRRLSGPEVTQHKTAQAKVRLELLDPVLTV